MRTTPLLCSLLFAATAAAQLQPGDIAITGFSSSSFGVLRSGTTTQHTAAAGFGGSTLCVLWDVTQANDVLLGGFGFVGRATVTGPGAVTFTSLTTNVGVVVQMSQDEAFGVVLIDAGPCQVRRLDPVSGAVTDLSFGPQPWGLDANAGAFDPATGDVVVGGNGELYRLVRGTVTAVPIAVGLGGYVSGVTFDPVTGDVIASVLTSNRIVRVDGTGAVTDVTPPFAVPGPNAITVDANGDFVTGGGVGQVYRVPRTGGAPVSIGALGPANPLNDLCVVGGGGGAFPYGQYCAAASGPSVLRGSGALQLGVPFALTSGNHAAGALGALVLGLSNTVHAGQALPLSLDGLLGTQGCFLHASLDVALLGVTGATAPADLVTAVTLPTGFAGYFVWAQHACFDPVPGGLSWSNGVALQAR
jgi:hypothetical protein